MTNALSFRRAAQADVDYWLEVEACYSRTWLNYKMNPHYHNRAEIMCVLKGTCNVQIIHMQNDSKRHTTIASRRVETLNAGEIIFLDVGVIHSLEVPGTCYIANVEFTLKPDRAGLLSMKRLSGSSPELARFLKEPPGVARGNDRHGKLYLALSCVIDGYLEKLGGCDDRALCDLQMAELMLRLTKALNSKQESLGMIYAEKAHAMLMRNFNQEIGVNDIAKAIGINPSYLQRVFKKAQGTTIIECLNRIRIDHAKMLLVNTNDPIIDIAVHSGFHSRQYFSRVFTQLTGQTPSAFRQTNQRTDLNEYYLFDSIHDIFLDHLG